MSDENMELPRISVTIPNGRLSRKVSGSAISENELIAAPQPEMSEIDKLKALRRGEGFNLSAKAIEELIELRLQATDTVFKQLNSINVDFKNNSFGANIPTLAPKLRGELLNPDGVPAERLIVEALRPVYGENEGVENNSFSWAVKKAVTDKRGMFSLELPSLRVPQNGLTLRFRGQNSTATEAFHRVDIIGGELGLVVLERTLLPLTRSVVGELADLFPVDPEDAEENITDFSGTQRPIVLGEGDCASEYRTEGGTVSRQRYSVLYRLVDPLVGPKNVSRTRTIGGRRYSASIPAVTVARAAITAENVLTAFNNDGGEWDFRDRIPIDEPIDVEDFFDELEKRPQNVPKASSLALGYVTNMRTTAVHVGMSLGRLVYSLPLAPGEEQRIVVSEQRESLTVRERESLTFSEEQEFQESRDTSFESVFDSAFTELVSGESDFETKSESSSKGGSGGGGIGLGLPFKGGGFLGIGGGGSGSSASSSSSSEGTASASQNTARDFLSETYEAFSAALERSASVKRRASRTSIRNASVTDRRSSTTKLIANRNHCHAMTMQWFEVLRDFSLETRVEGVQLVVFVPLQLIRFRRVGEPRSLPAEVTRKDLLDRYDVIVRHASTLRKVFRRGSRFRAALGLLDEFVSDREATPQNSEAGAAQDIVNFSVTGTFMANDDVSAVIFTKDGDRVGPVSLVGSSVDIDDFYDFPASNRENLIFRLAQARRDIEHGNVFTGSVALPSSVERSDIARVELQRSTGRFAYSFYVAEEEPPVNSILEAILAAKAENEKGIDTDDLDRASRSINRILNTSITGVDFDDLVGPPKIKDFIAKINNAAVSIVDDNSENDLPLTLPFSVQDVPEVLSRRDLRRIEEMYQHVVANTVGFSRAVWASISDEERAILLERYTIGVPEGGLDDASSEISLLSTVQNKVLGFYGNSMIMPFHIPPELAQEMEMTTGDVQDNLLRFHREGFRPPRRNLSLPTKGLLGEAVLGSCNSCEMIDHRRFWNWQDSPPPPPVSDPPSLAADSDAIFGTRAPSDLPQNQPTNTLTIAGGDIGTGQEVPTSQLAEILGAAPELARAGADLTGLKELQAQLAVDSASASAGRDKVIDTATDLTKDLVGKATELAGKAQELSAARRAENEKSVEESQKASAKQSTDAKKGFGEIAKNAPAVASLVGAQPTEEGRTALAQSLFANFPGGPESLADPENTLLAAQIFTSFINVLRDESHTEEQQLGSNAILGVLQSMGVPGGGSNE